MVGEVVVVFDGLEGRGFAEEPEVVDWDGLWEEGCQSLDGCVSEELSDDSAFRSPRIRTYRLACQVPSEGWERERDAED